MVLLVTVGLSTLAALFQLVRHQGAPTLPVTDLQLWALFGEELLVGAFVIWLLARRGWRLSATTAPLRGYDVLRGAGVLVCSWLALIALNLTFWLVAPGLQSTAVPFRFTGHVSWPAVVAVVLLDPTFEELLFLGYLVTRLRRHGLLVAAGVSIALRTLVHLYQGPTALLSVLPLGTLYTLYYVRTGRMWPVIVAHALQDALAFGVLMYTAR